MQLPTLKAQPCWLVMVMTMWSQFLLCYLDSNNSNNLKRSLADKHACDWIQTQKSTMNVRCTTSSTCTLWSTHQHTRCTAAHFMRLCSCFKESSKMNVIPGEARPSCTVTKWPNSLIKLHSVNKGEWFQHSEAEDGWSRRLLYSAISHTHRHLDEHH